MSDQALLVRTLVELADNLTDDFDVVDLLSLLSDRCVASLDVSAAGVMLAAPSGALEVVASSSEAMHTLELFQLQADQGPCIEAFNGGQAVVEADLAAAGGRWPQFAARALGLGFHSALSLPMRLRQKNLGALNILRHRVGRIGSDDIAIAQAFADIASIAIIQHQVVVDAQTLNTQLSVALNSRVVIEQAKGKVSEAAATDMDAAFRRLRNHARNHNLRLADLADQVAQGNLAPTDLDPIT